MPNSKNTTPNKRFDETVNLIVGGRAYDVHVEFLGAMSYRGYVIYRGTYFCTLPHAMSRQELLDAAQQRIHALT